MWTEQIISSIKDESKIDYGKVLRTTNPLYNGKLFYQPVEMNGVDDYCTNFCPPSLCFNYNQVLASALQVRQATEKLHINNMRSVGKNP